MSTPPTNHSAPEELRTGQSRIPTVTTERLILRSFTTADLDAYAELTADEETMRYLGEGARSIERAPGRCWQSSLATGTYAATGSGPWPTG